MIKEYGLLIHNLTSNSSKIFEQTKWKSQFKDKFTEKLKEQYDENAHELLVSNGIFITDNITLSIDYKIVAESFLKGEIKQLDFNKSIEATNYINNWIEEKTKGFAKKHFSGSLPRSTRFVLTNIIYFNAKWMDNFAVKKRDFYPKENHVKNVDMLTCTDEFPFYLHSKCNARVIGIPYQLNISTLYVFLPDRTENLVEFQKCLTPDTIEEIIQKMDKTKVEIWLPTFNIFKKIKLDENLKKMNLGTLFVSNKTDLSLIYTNGNSSNLSSIEKLEFLQTIPTEKIDSEFFVNDIIQEVHLEVSEKGTKGVAVTSVVGISLLNRGMIAEMIEQFVVDIPFLFLIRHDPTKIPIFYGVVFEPVEVNYENN